MYNGFICHIVDNTIRTASLLPTIILLCGIYNGSPRTTRARGYLNNRNKLYEHLHADADQMAIPAIME